MFLSVDVEQTTNEVITSVVTWISTEGVKLLIGIIFLLISFKIVNYISKKVVKRMQKKNADKTMISVIRQLLRKGLKIVCFVIFLEYVGVGTAGIGAIITSLGLAFGLAVQGSLSNFAGGVIILIMRPFKVDDFIEAQGQKGTVEEIRIFYTYIITTDNRVVMIPNGILANGTIINYSTKDIRRVDIEFSISYKEDFKKAIDVIDNLCETNDLILKDPKPFIRVISHGESAIKIISRSWVKNADYWTVYFYMIESVKEKFDELGIEIPYSKLDVNVINK